MEYMAKVANVVPDLGNENFTMYLHLDGGGLESCGIISSSVWKMGFQAILYRPETEISRFGLITDFFGLVWRALG